MKLSELIDAAVEAEAQFGDVNVAFIGRDSEGDHTVSFMDVCVAEVEGVPMFTFMLLDNQNNTVQ